MTKFEMVTLYLQQSLLLAQHPIAWVAGAICFVGCALIGAEFWFFHRELNAREKALDILMKQTADGSMGLDILMKRAEEDSPALRTLIERTSK